MKKSICGGVDLIRIYNTTNWRKLDNDLPVNSTVTRRKSCQSRPSNQIAE